MATERTKQLFGTDGIRGIPGEYPLDDVTLERVGSALGLHLAGPKNADSEPPRVLIGRDPRESGPHIVELIARGLVSAGAEPVSAGGGTTAGGLRVVGREGVFGGGGVFAVAH